jgi:beta-lactamase class A
MTTRRNFIIGTSAVAGISLFGGRTQAQDITSAKLRSDIARIEIESGGRLGVAILDTMTRAQVGHHADDLFPMCSTFKFLAAAVVLKRVDDEQEQLGRLIPVGAGDVVPGSSHIKTPVPGGLTMAELCEAAMIYSDNTAGNLILASLGGPQAITDYARTLGDTMTRLDRNEPTLNESIPGDPRDTTTPNAMLKNMQALLIGEALSTASKKQLTQWLLGNKTGDTRLRAGLPVGWRVGDKTGTGDRGSTNDIAIIWPPDRAPVLIATYLTETSAAPERRNATIADIARAVVKGMA